MRMGSYEANSHDWVESVGVLELLCGISNECGMASYQPLLFRGMCAALVCDNL